MGSGNCVFWAPETFDLSDDGHAVVLDPAATRRGAAAHRGRRAARSARSRCGATGPRSRSKRARSADRRHRGARGPPPHRQRWLQTHCPPTVPRAVAEAPGPARSCPAVWEKMAAQGWLGLHVAEAQGGQGFTLAELAVVLEELGHALFPGPVLPTCWSPPPSPGHPGGAVRGRSCPGWPTARSPPRCVSASRAPPRRGHRRRGDPSAGDRAPGAGTARRPGWCWCRSHGAERWSGSCSTATGSGTRCGSRHSPPSTAPGPLGVLELGGRRGHRPVDGTAGRPARRGRARPGAGAGGGRERRDRAAGASRRPRSTPRCGSSSGGPSASSRPSSTRWPTCWWRSSSVPRWPGTPRRPGADAATPTSGARSARCIARWPVALASRPLPTAPSSASRSSGGSASPGSTTPTSTSSGPWPTCSCWPAATSARSSTSVAALALGGARRDLAADLPPEAESLRDEIRAAVAGGGRGRRRPSSAPPWPRPGCHAALAAALGPGRLAPRAAGDRRGAGGGRRAAGPHLAVGAWALPTIIAHGTEEQQERWVRPTLLGQLSWCQLFSEPGAGSDLAALSTRAERVEGGWLLNGQKVWTSLAQTADFGICLARTDPDAPKHAGITYFIVDMRAEGIDIRPLRELTGAAMFNEVFFNDVFVPDDAVDRRVRATAGASDGPPWPTSASPCRRAPPSATGSSRSSGPWPAASGAATRPRRSLEGRLGHLIGGGPVDRPARPPGHAADALGGGPGQRLQRAQVARRRARAAGPGDGDGALRRRRRRCWTARPSAGRRASSPPGASPSPAAPARCSATSSPSGSSASPGTPSPAPEARRGGTLR